MWSSAPDGGCVGTGTAPRPGRGSFHGRTEERSPGRGTTLQTSGAIPWYGRRRGRVHLGGHPLYKGWACHDRAVMSATPPPDELPLGTEGYPAASGVARRPAGATESARANRRWWDAAAPAYLAEHGRDLGDVEFLWCPEGLREQDAHLLGDVTGRRVLEIGCGSAPCSRWLRRAGADPVALDLSAGMLTRAAGLNRLTGVDVPLL